MSVLGGDGVGVGVAVGRGVGRAVGRGVARGVGLGVGRGVGTGVGRGVGEGGWAVGSMGGVEGSADGDPGETEAGGSDPCAIEPDGPGRLDGDGEIAGPLPHPVTRTAQTSRITAGCRGRRAGRQVIARSGLVRRSALTNAMLAAPDGIPVAGPSRTGNRWRRRVPQPVELARGTRSNLLD